MGALVAVLGPRTADQRGAVMRMLDAAPYRGTNVMLHTEGRCSLGVVSPDGVDDASIAAERGVALATSGTIDNLDELSGRYGGHLPRPASPAAILLAAARELGDRFPGALRGAFTGVVTDGSSIRAFRDHIGFGVVHYAEYGGDLYVATEAKQVLAGSRLPGSPEPRFLESLLYGRFEDETLCAVEGVHRLPQASVLLGGPQAGVRWSRFWRPEDLLETAQLPMHEVQARFDELMTQAITRTLTGHDILALSGGIESTAIAAYAGPEYRRRWDRPLQALSAANPSYPGLDERALAKLAAEKLGLELHLLEAHAGPLDGLREWVQRCGPAPSSFSPPRELYRAARDLGYRAMLSGNYGELATDVGHQHLVTHLVRTRRVGGVRALVRAERARGVSRRSIARQLARAIVPSDLDDAYERWRRPGPRGPDWLDPTRLAPPTPRHVRAGGRWRQAQLASFGSPRLQVEAEEVEQAFYGVRMRWPWADVDLWEFFLRLPAETKHPDLWPRKLLVRRLLRGRVPDEILDRPQKIVYGAAEMRWIDYALLRELLSDPVVRIPGVDYQRLREHLRSEDLPARDFRYIRNLASIHVFLEEWPERARL